MARLDRKLKLAEVQAIADAEGGIVLLSTNYQMANANPTVAPA